MRREFSRTWMTGAAMALSCVLSLPVMALPSFARQTGAACEQCHTVAFGPALTPYGRLFKLNGYTWSKGEGSMPLAGMVQASFTHTAAAQPAPPADHTSVNDNVSLDQVSLFYGGRLGDHVGLFAQVTYSGPDEANSWDNLDLRYARTVSVGKHYAVVGLTVNNNPTVQDLWNTTPAWGFPYLSSALAPTPSAAPLLSGLGGVVLGASAYTLIDGIVYLEAGGYRGLSDRWLDNLGAGADADSHLQNSAPYLRAAVDKDIGAHHLHAGLLRFAGNVRPDPAEPAEDRYVDTGVDVMYQYFDGGPHSLTVNAMRIHESRTLDASLASGAASSTRSGLNTTTVEVTYAYRSTFAVSLASLDITGSTDAVLYPAGALSGSANGRPDSRAYTAQVEYIPFGKLRSPGRNWLNVRLGLQYTAYSTFNGASTNYDGAGRNASDNNTLFGYAWFLF